MQYSQDSEVTTESEVLDLDHLPSMTNDEIKETFKNTAETLKDLGLEVDGDLDNLPEESDEEYDDVNPEDLLDKIKEDQLESFRQDFNEIVNHIADSLDKLKTATTEQLALVEAERDEYLASDEYKALSVKEQKEKNKYYKAKISYYRLIIRNIREVKTQRCLINFIKDQKLLYVLADHKHLKEEYKKFRSYRRRYKFAGMNFDNFIIFAKKNRNREEVRNLTKFAYALFKYVNYLDKEHRGSYIRLRMTYFLYTSMMLNLSMSLPSSGNSKVVKELVSSFTRLDNK